LISENVCIKPTPPPTPTPTTTQIIIAYGQSVSMFKTLSNTPHHVKVDRDCRANDFISPISYIIIQILYHGVDQHC
jgi:hypothetical protein